MTLRFKKYVVAVGIIGALAPNSYANRTGTELPSMSPPEEESGQRMMTQAALIGGDGEAICVVDVRGRNDFATSFTPVAPEGFHSNYNSEIRACSEAEAAVVKETSFTALQISQISRTAGVPIVVAAGLALCTDPALIGGVAGMMSEFGLMDVPGSIPGTFAGAGYLGGGPSRLWSLAGPKAALMAVGIGAPIGYACGYAGDYVGKQLARGLKGIAGACGSCVQGVQYLIESVRSK